MCNWEGATDVVGANFAAENVVCLHLGGQRKTGLESAGWQSCRGAIGGNVVFGRRRGLKTTQNLEARPTLPASKLQQLACRSFALDTAAKMDASTGVERRVP